MPLPAAKLPSQNHGGHRGTLRGGSLGRASGGWGLPGRRGGPVFLPKKWARDQAEKGGIPEEALCRATASILHFRRSGGECKQGLKECPEFALVWGVRQSDEELSFQHFTGNRAAAVGVRGTTVRVVPGTRSAIGQLGLILVPAAQLDQGVQPLVQVPAAKVRPHVADLLLSRAPDFLDVVEVFFDRPARRSTA